MLVVIIIHSKHCGNIMSASSLLQQKRQREEKTKSSSPNSLAKLSIQLWLRRDVLKFEERRLSPVASSEEVTRIDAHGDTLVSVNLFVRWLEVKAESRRRDLPTREVSPLFYKKCPLVYKKCPLLCNVSLCLQSCPFV